MAVAAVAITGVKRNTAGSRTQVTRRVTFDSGYVTGGEALAASAFGLSEIQYVHSATIRSGFSAAFAHVDALTQTTGDLLLRLRAAAGTEVPNATDASTVVVDITAEGY